MKTLQESSFKFEMLAQINADMKSKNACFNFTTTLAAPFNTVGGLLSFVFLLLFMITSGQVLPGRYDYFEPLCLLVYFPQILPYFFAD